TPASGPGSSPAATRRSIAPAAASASAPATVRNSPSAGSTAAIRASAARVSSTDETSRRRTRAAASRTERSVSALTGSLDDLRDAEEAAVPRGRVQERLVAGGRVLHLVGAEERAEVLDVGRR